MSVKLEVLRGNSRLCDGPFRKVLRCNVQRPLRQTLYQRVEGGVKSARCFVNRILFRPFPRLLAHLALFFHLPAIQE